MVECRRFYCARRKKEREGKEKENIYKGSENIIIIVIINTYIHISIEHTLRMSVVLIYVSL
jgi:hypothetical protein